MLRNACARSESTSSGWTSREEASVNILTFSFRAERDTIHLWSPASYWNSFERNFGRGFPASDCGRCFLPKAGGPNPISTKRSPRSPRAMLRRPPHLPSPKRYDPLWQYRLPRTPRRRLRVSSRRCPRRSPSAFLPGLPDRSKAPRLLRPGYRYLCRSKNPPRAFPLRFNACRRSLPWSARRNLRPPLPMRISLEYSQRQRCISMSVRAPPCHHRLIVSSLKRSRPCYSHPEGIFP